MSKVITYGTYDMLHYGHIRLLERAKALGDYLIVGVTSDDFDKARGKINVQQPLLERVEALRRTGIPDEIIVEEYEGQKIDDIRRYDIDIFTVGSDWKGKFDYLNQYCRVVYLERTKGVSSSAVRSEIRKIRLGFVGDFESRILVKYFREAKIVNGIEIAGLFARDDGIKHILQDDQLYVTQNYSELLERCDAVYILAHPSDHYNMTKEALSRGIHVLCESPIALCVKDHEELRCIAAENGAILMDSIKTAYSTAYCRLLLLVKSGKIGDVVSIDATCTSIQEIDEENIDYAWNSISIWGPTALLPVFQLMGTEYSEIHIYSRLSDESRNFDQFTRINLSFPHGVASIKVGRGIKSEGELVISGTNGYIYVPAPWWKTDYFELRYENPADNKRYFYQLEGEGIRYELVDFVKTINSGIISTYVSPDVSASICDIMQMFYERKHVVLI